MVQMAKITSEYKHKSCRKTPACCGSPEHEQLDDDDAGPARSSVPMTSLNVINSILGSGIIGIPFALREAGVGLGVLLLVLVGIITDYSMLLLIKAGEMSKSERPTYQSVVAEAHGKVGFAIVSVLQFLYPMIAMISYNTILGDILTKLLSYLGGDTLAGTVLVSRQFVIFLVTLLVTLPLSLYKDIAKLSKWSAMSFGFIIILIIFVAVRLATYDLPTMGESLKFADIGVPKAIGIISFAYMSHHNCFLMYESLREPNQGNWAKVTHSSVVLCVQAALAMGVLGYFTFTGRTEGDLMQNYCSDDQVMNAGKFMFALTIMLTFPVECFVTREVIENVIFPHKQPPSLTRHILLTITLVTVAFLLSLITDCLHILLELNGVLTACPLAFIWPPLLVIKLQQKPLASVSNIPLLLVVMFGVFTSAVGLVMTIIEMIQGLNCTHGVEPLYCPIGNHSYWNDSWISAPDVTENPLINVSSASLV